MLDGVKTLIDPRRMKPVRRESFLMKKIIAVLLVLILTYCMLFSGAFAEKPEAQGNTIRFDVSEERYWALWENFYEKWQNGSDDLNHLYTYPIMPESTMRLLDEFRKNSSVLSMDENGCLLWYTEAAKVVYDERLLGARIWFEFGSEERRQELSADCIDGRNGIIRDYAGEKYPKEDISALRISYETGTWLNGYWGNAIFDLTYTVSGGRVNCETLDVIMEGGTYCMDWWMKRNNEDGSVMLSGYGENLAEDTSWSFNFDGATGEPLAQED